MTFPELVNFIENKMSMSHIYQPLLIKTLIDAGGSATIRQLAQSFLNNDESQLLYYEKRIKEMPVKVLSRHGVVVKEGDLVSLSIVTLSYQQKAHIRMLCDNRLQQFVQKRGLGLWDYRFLDSEPVPDSLRYIVLKNSGGRCALCGATKNERPLDVDHIKPRSRGGKTALDNLQVLCSKCNRSKRDQDATDFRESIRSAHEPSCLFCSTEIRPRIIEENGTVFAILDHFPVTESHSLIIPVRHTPDWFSMTSLERSHAEELLRILKSRIAEKDPSVTGFNIGMNCGRSAGQTILHAHIHLIPRRDGDSKNPRGGVRGVIPERMSY